MNEMNGRSKAELDLMIALEANQKVSQNKLASKLGIAAGLVNILIKQSAKRGLIKMKQMPARRFAYYLTPKGFAEKAKLVINYLDVSLNLYRKLRIEYRDIFTRLEAKGIREVTIVGDIDIAELTIMASFDSNITITALVNSKTNKVRVGPVPIVSFMKKKLKGALIICEARDPQACFDRLAEYSDIENLYYPESFYISSRKVCKDDAVS